MQRSKVFERLNATGQLPTPSHVALEVMRLSHDDHASLYEIADIIETDPALAAELLKYANSSMLSTGTPVTTIRRAAVKLGMRVVVSLALGFSLLSTHKQGRCPTFNYTRFWATSLAKGVAARSLAKRHTTLIADELFICGLLANIGELTLASLFPARYSELLAAQSSEQELLEAEQREFGIDQREIAVELFLDWGLPEHYAIAIRYHDGEIPEDLQQTATEMMARQLHLASLISQVCMQEGALAAKLDAAEAHAKACDINVDDFIGLFDSIVVTWQQWSQLFALPAFECPLYHQLRAMEKAQEVESNESFSLPGTMTIMAVDDDPITLMRLKKMLSTNGRSIITAENGEEALELALKYQPQLIITDWRMPHMTGLELCQMFRNARFSKHMYIIMLTGCEDDDELVKAFDAGADDYVVKPFSPKVLEARIRSGERMIKFQEAMTRDRELIKKYATQLTAANRKLKTIAMTDSLTNLPNRRQALERLREVVAETSRHQEELSCIMIDIDHFKRVNDTHGHDCGDIVLQEVATVLSSKARSYDMVSRTGGEEFLVISARSSLKDSQLLAERLRRAVEAHEVTLSAKTVNVTISLGVAAWNPSMPNGNALIQAADRALYQAKENGRNRVETTT